MKLPGTDVPTADPARTKACCAAAYGNDAVALVLGESYHPGGLELTRHLAGLLRLRPGARVADVACGPGTTALVLASDHGVSVDGVDLGAATLTRARAATDEAGLSPRVRLHLGDAERLPLPAAAVDAVVCECAFCTFPDKPGAAAELARVLRPGGRVGITDVTVAPAGLPEELHTLASWVACIADARPLDGYVDILAGAGLRTIRTETHDAAMTRMIEQIQARLTVLQMTSPDPLVAAGVDVASVLGHLALAGQAVDDGLIGYGLLVAEKP